MKIIFDTNVLISAFVFKGFSQTVYDFCVINYTLFISEWILEKLEEKLRVKFEIPEDKIINTLYLVKEKSAIEQPLIPVPNICRDEDDNNILQLADSISANFIITGDKDLLVFKKYKSTEIITPREFYERFIDKKKFN